MRTELMNWVRPLARLIPPRLLLRRLPPSAGRDVLLTFDDGPHRRVTPQVLDRLREYGVRAVFFVVGRRIEQAPELLRRIVTEGHAIGNHSFRHERVRPLDLLGYRRDLLRCQALIERHSGTRPRLFRPPFGQLSPASLAAPLSLGLRTVGWSLDSGDWRCKTAAGAQQAADSILQRLMPRDIVLLHDDNPAVLTILDRILPVMTLRHAAPRAA
jgi:peptidoglycan/xylan/chitin deacetylase (PgdA/CDA1 family)